MHENRWAEKIKKRAGRSAGWRHRRDLGGQGIKRQNVEDESLGKVHKAQSSGNSSIRKLQ